MTKRIRTAVVAIAGALGLFVAPIALAAPAAAAPVSNVLFFSNDAYTDPEPDEEDEAQIAALTAAGATVTVFDGGDGSAAVWTAALEGKQALVIPESNQIFDTAVLSVEAAAVVKAFVADGGTLFLPTEYQSELLSYITGVDFDSVWQTGGNGSPWARAFPDEAFPAELAYSDGTYPVNVGSWTDEHYDVSSPLYYNLVTGDLAVGAFMPETGSGTVYTLAYDWFPSDDPADIAAAAVWNTVLGLLLPFVDVAPAPAPELAATGSSVDTNVVIAGAAMLLLAGAAIVATSRRKASA